ncbi:MAG: acetyl-CoA carboxylase biotin carboxyl carrier protein [Magnetococcales bacterium]|nr:acetyl-CoA carboxylase biotin carboxyl carrier protein [Magnetococcales bacterium]
MDLKDIRQLLKMLAGSDVAEIEIRQADGAVVRVTRERAAVAPPMPPLHPAATQAPGGMPIAGYFPFGLAGGPALADPPEATEKRSPTAIAVTSPMVGTFYDAPAPDAAPFVKVGDRVEKGGILCIIEAMKLMNEVESEVSGRVIEIIKGNASPVEYGEELFLIEPG